MNLLNTGGVQGGNILSNFSNYKNRMYGNQQPNSGTLPAPANPPPTPAPARQQTPMMFFSTPNMTGGGMGGGRNQELMGTGQSMMMPMPGWLYDKWQPMHEEFQQAIEPYKPGLQMALDRIGKGK